VFGLQQNFRGKHVATFCNCTDLCPSELPNVTLCNYNKRRYFAIYKNVLADNQILKIACLSKNPNIFN
jgi:hypothetical protein